MDLTVAVASFGSTDWLELSERAIDSATPQAPVVHIHGDTLHGARNEALEFVETEWVVFLDADDEIEPGYIDAMAAGAADVRAPAVRYVRGTRAFDPGVPKVAGHTHDCGAGCLPDGNWLVIGSAVRAELVRQVGGWRDWPMYEDWDLWLRCHLAGATMEAIPSAVYRAHVRLDSRNRAPSIATKNAVHRAIVAANLPRFQTGGFVSQPTRALLHGSESILPAA